ncbi:MAG: DMT family transporter [Kangiellaceae bacterium]|nr:DMT family transporter [Kangiellaceae bacterium]
MAIGEIFALSSAMVWAVAVIMYTRIGDTMPALELNLVKNSIGFLLLALTAITFESHQLPTMSMTDWTIVIISGVIGIAIADTFYMKALNTIGAGSTGVVAALYSPFVIILSMLYLGERLSIGQWFGLISVLTGVVFISLDKPSKKLTNKLLWAGISYGVLAVFLTAFGVVAVKPILEQQPFFWSSTTRLAAGVISMLIYLVLAGRWHKTRIELTKPHHWRSIIIASVLGAYLAMTLWLAGYKYADASIAAVLNETTSIFIVLLAWLILKEPLTKLKVTGTLCAIAGVIMIITL